MNNLCGLFQVHAPCQTLPLVYFMFSAFAQLLRLTIPSADCHIATFNHGSTIIAASNERHATILFSVQTGQKIATLQENTSTSSMYRTNRPCFSPCDDLVLSDGELKAISFPFPFPPYYCSVSLLMIHIFVCASHQERCGILAIRGPFIDLTGSQIMEEVFSTRPEEK